MTKKPMNKKRLQHLTPQTGESRKLLGQPMIAEAVTPPEFPNKEELETDFAPMTEEDGIKEELVARSDPQEFIPQTEPRLR